MHLNSSYFREGYDAYLCGLSKGDNPYDDWYEEEEWENGYYQAMEDD